MRFSKPSPLELENGRLLGSAQMPSSLARAALATNNTVAKIAVPKTDVKEQLLLSAFEKGGRRGNCSLCDLRPSPLFQRGVVQRRCSADVTAVRKRKASLPSPCVREDPSLH